MKKIFILSSYFFLFFDPLVFPQNVGIGTNFPNGNLQFSNIINSRKIVLWETGNNDNQYYGFGINGGTLRYNIDAPGSVHRFYAGNGSGSSNLLFSIWGNKQVSHLLK